MGRTPSHGGHVLWKFVTLSLLLHLAAAAVVSYDFNVSWVSANPDGAHVRPVIGVNGAWPPPAIRADVGDSLVVRLRNQLGNQSTSLHFHGLFMRNATHMDGAVQVSQCALPPGKEMVYNFTVDQPGTYWYHSHSSGQYPDGLRAPLLVHDPDAPFRYDEERFLTLSDWYHDQMPDLLAGFLAKSNPTGAEPVPQAALLNDTQNLTVAVAPGKTYLFRAVNVGAFAGQYLWFEGHNVTVVEVDGVYTQPTPASMLYLTAAQRCSFLLTARNDTGDAVKNYAFVASMDWSMFDTVPPDLNYNATGWLVYDANQALLDPATIDAYNPLNDAGLLPYDNMTLLGDPDIHVELDVVMQTLGDGANYAFFNNVTYRRPKVPTLYTALTAPASLVNDSRIYGAYTGTTVVPRRGQIVELVVNNRDVGRHPFHLHGHNFQIAYRSDPSAGTYNASNTTLLASPIRRDSLLVSPSGYAVLRFRADNPGVWLFHCHIEWHLASGLVATFVEAPADLQAQYDPATGGGSSPLPADHLAACAAAGVPTAGNAAGNTANLLDLTGEDAPPPALPDGFTPRGIVALVFSCVSGVLGVAVVAWYGLADGGDADPDTYAAARQQMHAAGVAAPDEEEAAPNNSEARRREALLRQAATTAGHGVVPSAAVDEQPSGGLKNVAVPGGGAQAGA